MGGTSAPSFRPLPLRKSSKAVLPLLLFGQPGQGDVTRPRPRPPRRSPVWQTSCRSYWTRFRKRLFAEALRQGPRRGQTHRNAQQLAEPMANGSDVEGSCGSPLKGVAQESRFSVQGWQAFRCGAAPGVRKGRGSFGSSYSKQRRGTGTAKIASAKRSPLPRLVVNHPLGGEARVGSLSPNSLVERERKLHGRLLPSQRRTAARRTPATANLPAPA